MIVGLALLLALVTPEPYWEEWEPKNVLPTEAIETLEEQAVWLIPPQEVTTPDPIPTTGVERWRPLVEAYDWNVRTVLDIMMCESRGVPTAVSHTDDHGLMQIHYPIWGPHYGVSRSDLYDPVTNIDIAYQVYAQQGYRAWVCFR